MGVEIVVVRPRVHDIGGFIEMKFARPPIVVQTVSEVDRLLDQHRQHAVIVTKDVHDARGRRVKRSEAFENYATATESLPFIADDILVHFDDARTQATLKLLASFGQSNQVLLFTHHRSVRDAGAALALEGSANVVELEHRS